MTPSGTQSGFATVLVGSVGERLWLGLTVLAVAASSVAGQAQAPAAQLPESMPALGPAYELQISVADGFSLAAVGDLILAYPSSQRRDPGFLGVIRLLRDADAAFGNFELSALDSRRLEAPSGRFAGPRAIARDIQELGFDLVARANNHLLDFGVRGMLATNDTLEEGGLVYAGSGSSLGAARAPRYFEREKGRRKCRPDPTLR